MTSVERVLMYSDLPQEESEKRKPIKPDDTWPKTGCLQFDKVSLSYDDGETYVLKSLSFTIKDKEKVCRFVLIIQNNDNQVSFSYKPLIGNCFHCNPHIF